MIVNGVPLAVGDIVEAEHKRMDGSLVKLGPWLVSRVDPVKVRGRRSDRRGWLQAEQRLYPRHTNLTIVGHEDYAPPLGRHPKKEKAKPPESWIVEKRNLLAIIMRQNERLIALRQEPEEVPS